MMLFSMFLRKYYLSIAVGLLFLLNSCSTKESSNRIEKSSEQITKKAESENIPDEVTKSEPSELKHSPINQETIRPVISNDDVALVMENDVQRFPEVGGYKKSIFTTIKGNSISKVEGEEGISITIPANAFVNAKGQVVTGDIVVELKEFTNEADMILNNLSTTAGNQLLETGGMFYINATAAGEQLQIAPNAKLQVEMTTMNPMEGMQVFSGNHDPHGLDWNLTSRNNRVKTIDNSMVVSEKFTTVSLSYYEKNQAKRIVTSDNVTFRDSSKVDTLEYEVNFTKNGKISTVKLITADGPLQNSIPKINFINNLTRYTITANGQSSKKKYDGYNITFINKEKLNEYKTMPNKRKIQKTKVYRHESRLDDVLLSDKFTDREIKKMKTIRFKEVITTENNLFYRSLNAPLTEKEYANWLSQSTQASATELSYYSFSVMKLGYINCDRFVNDPRPKFVLEVPKRNNEGAQLTLVLSSYKSFLAAADAKTQFNFAGIPEGENLKLVSIKRKDGKVFLAHVALKMAKNLNLPELAYKEVPVDKIKEELQSLIN